jgi:hypothetical protein
MAIMLTIREILFGAFGIYATAMGRGAVDAIEAMIGFLIATVPVGCGGIIEAVKTSKKDKTAEG